MVRKVETANDGQVQISNMRTTYFNHQLTLQLCVLNINNQQFICIYEDIFYTFEIILQAVACAFELRFVFNLQYQAECKQVWELLQTFFFNIH